MILAFAAATLIAVTYPASHHFVYGFTINTAPASSGANAAKSDAGSITVDVLHVQSDTGTVVSVSEQSRARKPAQATCVTYGSGLVVCSPIESVSVEEMCVLRLLGRNFVNFAEIDHKRAWQNGASDGRARETNSFRITGQSKTVLDIAFDRVLNVQGADGYVSTTKGQLSYDATSDAPTSVTQHTIIQPQIGSSVATVEDLTLTLQTVSLTSLSA